MSAMTDFQFPVYPSRSFTQPTWDSAHAYSTTNPLALLFLVSMILASLTNSRSCPLDKVNHSHKVRFVLHLKSKTGSLQHHCKVIPPVRSALSFPNRMFCVLKISCVPGVPSDLHGPRTRESRVLDRMRWDLKSWNSLCLYYFPLCTCAHDETCLYAYICLRTCVHVYTPACLVVATSTTYKAQVSLVRPVEREIWNFYYQAGCTP